MVIFSIIALVIIIIGATIGFWELEKILFKKDEIAPLVIFAAVYFLIMMAIIERIIIWGQQLNLH